MQADQCANTAISTQKRAPAACDRMLKANVRLGEIRDRLSGLTRLLGASVPPNNKEEMDKLPEEKVVGLVHFLENYQRQVNERCSEIESIVAAIENTF